MGKYVITGICKDKSGGAINSIGADPGDVLYVDERYVNTVWTKYKQFAFRFPKKRDAKDFLRRHKGNVKSKTSWLRDRIVVPAELID